MNRINQLETQIQALLQELKALSDEELVAGLNFPCRVDEDFPPEVQRDHSLRQELAREILAIRRVPLIEHETVERTKSTNSDGVAASGQTVCQHVNVRQTDGSIARFHTRVPAPPSSAAQQISHADLLEGVTIACAAINPADKGRRVLESIWRLTSANGKPMSSKEIKALKTPD